MREWHVLIPVGLVLALIGVAFYFVLTEQRPSDAETAAGARRWADRMGIHITGVECNRMGYCTFGRGDGQPFVALCDGDRCIMQVGK